MPVVSLGTGVDAEVEGGAEADAETDAEGEVDADAEAEAEAGAVEGVDATGVALFAGGSSSSDSLAGARFGFFVSAIGDDSVDAEK